MVRFMYVNLASQYFVMIHFERTTAFCVLDYYTGPIHLFKNQIYILTDPPCLLFIDNIKFQIINELLLLFIHLFL